MKKAIILSTLVLFGLITISQITPKPPIAPKQPIKEKIFFPEPPPNPPNPPAPPVPPAAPTFATEKVPVIAPPPPPPPPTKMYRR